MMREGAGGEQPREIRATRPPPSSSSSAMVEHGQNIGGVVGSGVGRSYVEVARGGAKAGPWIGSFTFGRKVISLSLSGGSETSGRIAEGGSRRPRHEILDYQDFLLIRNHLRVEGSKKFELCGKLSAHRELWRGWNKGGFFLGIKKGESFAIVLPIDSPLSLRKGMNHLIELMRNKREAGKANCSRAEEAVWVRIFNVPDPMRNLVCLESIGKALGGFEEWDQTAAAKKEWRWVRLLIKTTLNPLPSAIYCGNGEEAFKMVVWAEREAERMPSMKMGCWVEGEFGALAAGSQDGRVPQQIPLLDPLAEETRYWPNFGDHCCSGIAKLSDLQELFRGEPTVPTEAEGNLQGMKAAPVLAPVQAVEAVYYGASVFVTEETGLPPGTAGDGLHQPDVCQFGGHQVEKLAVFKESVQGSLCGMRPGPLDETGEENEIDLDQEKVENFESNFFNLVERNSGHHLAAEASESGSSQPPGFEEFRNTWGVNQRAEEEMEGDSCADANQAPDKATGCSNFESLVSEGSFFRSQNEMLAMEVEDDKVEETESSEKEGSESSDSDCENIELTIQGMFNNELADQFQCLVADIDRAEKKSKRKRKKKNKGITKQGGPLSRQVLRHGGNLLHKSTSNERNKPITVSK